MGVACRFAQDRWSFADDFLFHIYHLKKEDVMVCGYKNVDTAKRYWEFKEITQKHTQEKNAHYCYHFCRSSFLLDLETSEGEKSLFERIKNNNVFVHVSA